MRLLVHQSSRCEHHIGRVRTSYRSRAIFVAGSCPANREPPPPERQFPPERVGASVMRYNKRGLQAVEDGGVPVRGIARIYEGIGASALQAGEPDT